jgi:hypothetical protein
MTGRNLTPETFKPFNILFQQVYGYLITLCRGAFKIRKTFENNGAENLSKDM